MVTPNEEIQTEIELQKLQFDKLFNSFAAENPYRSSASVRENTLVDYLNKLNTLKKNATQLGILNKYENQFYKLQYQYLCYSYASMDGINPDNLYKGKARFYNNSGYIDKMIENYNANYNPACMHIMSEGPETEKDVVRFFENVLFNPRLAEYIPQDILVAGELTPDPSASFFPYFQKELDIADNGHVVKTNINDLNPVNQIGSITHYELNIIFNGKKKTINVHQMNKFPDHGLLQLQECDLLALLEIFQQTKATGLVMHCRAGLGRTGLLELVYLAFNNPDQYFNVDGSVNYGAFYHCLESLRKNVRPRIVQSIAQGMNAIEISQQLIRLYLTLKRAHEQSQQQSYQGDPNAIAQLLNYYLTGKPAFEVAEVRESDFMAWSSKIIQSDNVSEQDKCIVKKEIDFKNGIKPLFIGPQFIDQLDRMARQEVSLAIKILCDSHLTKLLSMNRCLDILIYHQGSPELFQHVYLRKCYSHLFTAYAMRNVANAKQCLTNDNIRGFINHTVVLKKYLSDPRFFSSLTFAHLKQISGQIDFMTRFTDCSDVASAEVLRKSEEFYRSDQLTEAERERLKRFLVVQYGVNQIIKEKGQKSVIVAAINFEENNVVLDIVIQINNYTSRNERIILSMAELEKKATAYQQLLKSQTDKKEGAPTLLNRSDRAHQHHLNLMQRQPSNKANDQTADESKQLNSNPTMGYKPG